jgi:hypothetical protein
MPSATCSGAAALRDRLRQFVQYHRFLDDVLTLRIEAAGARARITLDSSDPDHLSRTVSEFLLAILTRAARVETGRADLDPVAVEFGFAAPEDTTEHRRFFRAPLRFGQPTNTLVLHRPDLDLPFLHADPGCAGARAASTGRDRACLRSTPSPPVRGPSSARSSRAASPRRRRSGAASA